MKLFCSEYVLEFMALNFYYNTYLQYTKAIELDPNYSNAYFNRGISKLILSDKIGACLDLRKGLKLNPNNLNFNKLIKDYCN